MRLLYFARNILSNYALAAVTGLAGFVLTPILFHSLQPANYAILVFALNAVAVMQGIELGLFTALVRFTSTLAAEQKHAELRCLASSGFYFLFGLGALATLTLLSLSPFLARFFRLGGSAAAPGHLVLALLSLSLMFQLPGNGLRAFLEGCQDFPRANAVDITMQLFRVAGTLLLLWAGFGLLAIAALFSLTSLIRLLGMLFISRQATIPFRPSLAEVNFKSLRQIRHFASLSFLEENANGCFFRLDIFLAARLLSLPDLAILTVARRLPWAIRDFCMQPLSVAYPMLSSAEARGDRRMIQKFLFLSARNLLAFALPLAVGLYVWAAVVLRLWVGQEVLAGVPVFRMYLIFAVFASLQEVPLFLLYGMGQIRFSAALILVMLATGIPAGAWACWRGGLWGMAVALAVIQAVGTVVLLRQAIRLAEVDLGRWLKKAVAPPVLTVLPAAAWFWVSSRFLPHTVAGLAVSLVLGFMLFLGLLARWVAGSIKQPWHVRARKLLTEVD